MSVRAGQSALEPRSSFSILSTGLLAKQHCRGPALSSSSAQFDFNMLNAKSREERINLELRLCELLLSGHDFFSRVYSRGERERERERE